MLTPAELVFWVCLAIGLYPYAGYPLCVAVLRAIRPRPVRAAPITPRVTVVISAYNEASHIEATVRNKLDQDYLRGLLDVMVVSDGSTDGTDQVLTRLALQDPRVTFFRQEPRAGKTAALNWLLERARGEIIVFADANSMYRPDTVRELVAHLRTRGPGYGEAFADMSRLRAAVNLDHVDLDAKVTANDEVAFFPPVTGG